MDIVETNSNATTIQLSIGHQAVKMVLSTVAAFLAGKAAEQAYDKIIEYRLNSRGASAIEVDSAEL